MAAKEVAELKRKNSELEQKLVEGKEREESLRSELERTVERLRLVEDAEERLCGELTELEAEAVDHAREYHLRVAALSEQLELFKRLLSGAGPKPLPGIISQVLDMCK